jgi:hypothetical protein
VFFGSSISHAFVPCFKEECEDIVSTPYFFLPYFCLSSNVGAQALEESAHALQNAHDETVRAVAAAEAEWMQVRLSNTQYSFRLNFFCRSSISDVFILRISR